VQWAAKIVFVVQKLSRKDNLPNDKFVLFMYFQCRIFTLYNYVALTTLTLIDFFKLPT